MSELKFGLIGTGRIGQVHAKTISSLPGVTLHRVADVDNESARSTAENYGASVSFPEEIFDLKDLDAVVIASPTPTHLDLIRASVKADLPVLCEKPIDLEIERVKESRAEIVSSGVPVAIGFNRRFDPHNQNFRKRITAGEIGTLEQVQIISRDPSPASPEYLAVSGGIFRDMTIHDFDLARYFVGDFVEVSANGYNQFSAEIRELGDFDATAVALRGPNDELVFISNSRHSAYGFDQRIEALGSLGMVRVDNVSDTQVRLFTADSVESREPYQNFFLERHEDSFRLELAEFVKLIKGQPADCPSFDDGLAALALANAANESARSGRVIQLDPKP